jgi:yecA family protein
LHAGPENQPTKCRSSPFHYLSLGGLTVRSNPSALFPTANLPQDTPCPVTTANTPSMMLQPTPLTEDELDELDQYLLYGAESDEAMVIDVLDGYLHAIAIAPITLHPRQWLPKIWGTDQMMPSGESLDRINHILGLVFRHYNSIIANLESNPPELYTTWATTLYRGKEYDDAEGWAYGFSRGHAALLERLATAAEHQRRPSLVSSHRTPGGA